jgi:uncharacterized protein YjbJ (UPF0337 family)
MEEMMGDKKDMATEGTEERDEALVDKVTGRVRNVVGGATGDTSEQIKGKAQEIKGKIKDKIGKAKQRSDPDPGVG